MWSLGRDGSLIHFSLLAGHPRLWAGGNAGLSLAPEGGHCLGPGPGGRRSAVYRLLGGAGGELEAVLRLGGEEDTVAGWAGADCGPLYAGGLAGTVRVYTHRCHLYFRPTVYVPCLVHSV